MSDPGSSSHRAIPLAEPSLRGNEERYLAECVQTGWVSYRGPFVDQFESELKASVGGGHAVALSSGTAALHLALSMAGVEPGDEVVMPALSFVAPANAIRYCGAWPALVDLHLDTWQLDLDALEDFLVSGCVRAGGALLNRVTGRRIAALLPVHLLGDMVDVARLATLAAEHRLPLVEDAAECMGARFDGRGLAAHLAESRAPFHVSITSFNGNKTITTGGGGALFTADQAVAARARHLSTTARQPGLELAHDEVGFNYRMSNLAAAVGVAQLERLDELVACKHAIAARYDDAFSAEPRITSMPRQPRSQSSDWLPAVLLPGSSRPALERLVAANIHARPLWTPIHRLPPFARDAHVHSRVVAEELHRRGLCLPSSCDLAPAEQQRVIEALRDAVAATPDERRPAPAS